MTDSTKRGIRVDPGSLPYGHVAPDPLFAGPPAPGHVRDDPRPFWYYAVVPGRADEIESVVEQCIANGNRMLFNHYSDVCGQGGETWEHFSWIMINMRRHLGSRREFGDWLTTMFAFYLVNRLVDFDAGWKLMHAARLEAIPDLERATWPH